MSKVDYVAVAKETTKLAELHKVGPYAGYELVLAMAKFAQARIDAGTWVAGVEEDEAAYLGFWISFAVVLAFIGQEETAHRVQRIVTSPFLTIDTNDVQIGVLEDIIADAKKANESVKPGEVAAA